MFLVATATVDFELISQANQGAFSMKICFTVLLIMIKGPDELATQNLRTRQQVNWHQEKNDHDSVDERTKGSRTLPHLYLQQVFSGCTDDETNTCYNTEKLSATKDASDRERLTRLDVAHRNIPVIREESYTEDLKQKNDQRRMELHDLKLCYEPLQPTTKDSREKLNSIVHDLDLQEPLQEDSCINMPSPHEDDRFRDVYMESRTTRQLVENYCKALKELEVQRKVNFELFQSRDELENELRLLRNEIATCRTAAENETAVRERIQQDLRKLADSLECGPVSGTSRTTRITRSEAHASSVESIEYYRDQFRIYQEDFKEEKEEKERIRVLNLRLTSELEEAKREIESYQKKLLVYAQIFSNSTPNQMVIPPAYIGRRVHSNPTTPSYSHGHSAVPGRNPYNGITQQENPQRRAAAYDHYLQDVIPKGSGEINQAKFSFDEGAPSRSPAQDVLTTQETELSRKRSFSVQN